jgi:hypothetical protein
MLASGAGMNMRQFHCSRGRSLWNQRPIQSAESNEEVQTLHTSPVFTVPDQIS